MFGKTPETDKLAEYLYLDEYSKKLIERFNVNEKDEAHSLDVLAAILNKSLISSPWMFYCFRFFDSHFLIPRSQNDDEIEIKKNLLKANKQERHFLPFSNRVKIKYSIWILDLPEDIKRPEGIFDSFNLFTELLKLQNNGELSLVGVQIENISDLLTFSLELDITGLIYEEKDELRFNLETGNIYFDGHNGNLKRGTLQFALTAAVVDAKGMKLSLENLSRFAKPLLSHNKTFTNWTQVRQAIYEIKIELKLPENSYFPVEIGGNKNNKFVILISK